MSIFFKGFPSMIFKNIPFCEGKIYTPSFLEFVSCICFCLVVVCARHAKVDVDSVGETQQGWWFRFDRLNLRQGVII